MDKHQLKNIIRLAKQKLLSPSMRFELKMGRAWLRERIDLASFWRWEIVRFPQKDKSQFKLYYVGRKQFRELAKILLGVENTLDSHPISAGITNQKVIISELPLPGALCVPKYLRTIVPLGRPVEEIMTEFDIKLRRSIEKNRPYYRMKQALTDAEIEYADRELLRPFASARHGNSANQMPLETVRKIAKEFGRLDFVLKDDEIVACLLGYEYSYAGKRYWIVDRFGYPEAVFSDPKRLGETNSMNNHLELEWAIENGYDYYDIGLAFARPDDGLLTWKRRRGAVLRMIGLGEYSHFYIKLPKIGAEKFLWETPLFAIEGGKLSLHLGLSERHSEEEFLTRYNKMSFGGLRKIYLHCIKAPRESLLATLRNFYKHQHSPPIIERVLSFICVNNYEFISNFGNVLTDFDFIIA